MKKLLAIIIVVALVIVIVALAGKTEQNLPIIEDPLATMPAEENPVVVPDMQSEEGVTPMDEATSTEATPAEGSTEVKPQ